MRKKTNPIQYYVEFDRKTFAINVDFAREKLCIKRTSPAVHYRKVSAKTLFVYFIV